MTEQQPSTSARVGRLVGRAANAGGLVAVNGARRTRAAIRSDERADRVYRTGVGVVGTGAVALGVVMIPLPGPGSLIALGGLAVLGSEFEGAKKVSGKANTAARKAFAAAKERKRRRDAAASDRPDPATGDR